MTTKYKQLSKISGLSTKKQRLSVSGYKRKRIDLKQYYKNNLIGLKKGDVEIKEIGQHLYDRQKERDFKMVDLRDAFTNPLDYGKITYNSKRQKSIQFIGRSATIYVNPDNGRITTAHKTHTKLRKKLEDRSDEK